MKNIYLLFICSSLIIFAGCFPLVMHMPSGGVVPSYLITDVSYPSKWDSEGVKHTIRGNYKYKIISPVKVTTESKNVLGIIAQGDSGYKKLLEKAKNMGADNVINVVIDTKYSYYLGGLFQRVRTELYGLAIKYVLDEKPLSKVRKKIIVPPTTVIKKIKIEKPDKNKKYFVNLGGEKYGPLEYIKIKALKEMDFVDDNTIVSEAESGKKFKVGDFE